MNKQQFIKELLPGALKAHVTEHLFVSVVLDQILLESGNGQDCPGNNAGGIKWTDGCGYDWQLLVTEEDYNLAEFNKLKASDGWYKLIAEKNGTYLVQIKAKFRKYKTLADFVLDYVKFLSTKRYASVRASKTYQQACEQLKADGYATDISYVTLLESVIQSNKLYIYDK